jgi:hypothetical protein
METAHGATRFHIEDVVADSVDPPEGRRQRAAAVRRAIDRRSERTLPQTKEIGEAGIGYPVRRLTAAAEGPS